jgi:hypothetical protein
MLQLVPPETPPQKYCLGGKLMSQLSGVVGSWNWLQLVWSAGQE